MATMDKAREVKALLKANLGKPEWLRGIGIGVDPQGDPVIRVNVARDTEEIRKAIPASLEEVAVELFIVGEAAAFS